MISRNTQGLTITTKTIVRRAGRALLQSVLLLAAAGALAEPFVYIPNLFDQNVNPSNKVAVLDAATNTVVATVTVGTRPSAIAVHPSGNRVYVGDGNGISVIDTASNTAVSTFGPGLSITYMAMNADGSRLYATASWSVVLVIDTASNTIINSRTLDQTQVAALAINPAGTRLYVAHHNNVDILDAVSLASVGSVAVPGFIAREVRLNAAGTRAYFTHLGVDPVSNDTVGFVSVLDTNSNAILATIRTGTFPTGLAIHPDGSRVYVVGQNDNALWIINTATNSVAGAVQLTSPTSVGINSTGTRVYVTNYVANGTVSVLDTTCNSVQAIVPVGSYPLAWGPFVGYAGPYVPPPGGSGPPANVEITGIEVTQAIQDLANSVQLVAGRKTFVRVYVKSLGPAAPGVTAALRGIGFYSTAGGPVTVPLGSLLPSNSSGPRITVQPSPKRSNLNESFLFELPSNWSNFLGIRILPVLHDKPGPVPPGCPNDALAGNLHSFAIPTNLKVAFVRMGYRTTGAAVIPNTFAQASVAEQRQSESFIRRTYPLWSLQPAPDYPLFNAALGARVDRSAAECQDLEVDDRNMCAHNFVSTTLAALQDSTGFMGDADVGYGLIPQVPEPPAPVSLLFTRGACCTEKFATGPSNSIDYAAHEIGHFLGRGHPAHGTFRCGHDAMDAGYPYWESYIGTGSLGPMPSSTPETDMAGFDVGDPALAAPAAVAFIAGQAASDNMGYCKPSWTSDYTYEALYTSLRALHPSIGGVSTGLAISAGGPGPVTPQSGNWLMLYGTISADASKATIIHAQRVDRVASIPTQTPGDYSIRLLGAGGTVLADYSFTPAVIADSGNSGQPGSSLQGFGQVVPFVLGTQGIEILDTSGAPGVIGTIAVSANSPTLSSVAVPGVQNPVTGTVTLNWTANDADGDAMTFDVFLRRDGGNGSESLQPLLLSLTGSTADIDTARFGGGAAQFRVVASDGVQSSFADTSEFVLGDKPPVPRIVTPGVTTTIYRGQSLNFEGEVTDLQLQDGDTPSITVEWSIPGTLLGTEGQITIDDLPLGDNVVTLTATSSLGFSASTSVNVIVLDPDDQPGPTLTAGPASIGWHVADGETALQSATLYIGNSGSGVLQYMAASNAPWLSLDVASGAAPATLTLTADPAGLASGVSASAEVTLTVVGDPGQQITVPVVLSVGNTFQFPVAEVAPVQSAPVIVSGTGTFAVNEDVATGTIITTINATDADGDALTYAITFGNNAGRFAIDNTGVVRVAAALDYETQTSHALTVSVDDGNNAPVTGAVTVNVVDVVENPPPPPPPPPKPRKGGGSADPLELVLLLLVGLAATRSRKARVKARGCS